MEYSKTALYILIVVSTLVIAFIIGVSFENIQAPAIFIFVVLIIAFIYSYTKNSSKDPNKDKK